MEQEVAVPLPMMVDSDPFVIIMDNGNRFHLRVIGITPLNSRQWQSVEGETLHVQ
jgi:hypothetical protein